MASQVNSVTFCLNKLIIFMSYVGVLSLKFNQLTNRFEKCSKWTGNTKFMIIFLLNIVYFVCVASSVNSRWSNMFILDICVLTYSYVMIILAFSVTLVDKKYEKITIDTLNNLLRFQNFTCKTSLKEIAVLIICFGETLCRLVSIAGHILYQIISTDRSNPKNYYFNISVQLLIHYFAIIMILFEGRLTLFYIVIKQYCRYFHKNWVKNCERTFTEYQYLLEIAANVNKIFSPLFFWYIGFYFVSLLLGVILLYCGFHDQQGMVMTNVEIFALIHVAVKFVAIIVVPTDAMRKVVEINPFFQKILMVHVLGQRNEQNNIQKTCKI
jgi:hypothetical protein